MALLENFGPQSIRQKLRLGTLFLAIIPVIVTSLIVGKLFRLAPPPDDPCGPQAANATSMMASATARITFRRS